MKKQFVYNKHKGASPANNNDLTVIEDKLAWIVYIINAILKIKQCTGCK